MADPVVINVKGRMIEKLDVPSESLDFLVHWLDMSILGIDSLVLWSYLFQVQQFLISLMAGLDDQTDKMTRPRNERRTSNK